MPARRNAPGEYSTNPYTVKARRRRMNLQGAKKVEEAARLADYKAMLHTRKTVQLDPSFGTATESEKATMLEEAMRQTMEKRRERGQDTMSKMAAFKAGSYRDRGGALGSQTRVPISAFLEDNGFVPSRPTRATQRGASAGGSNTGRADQRRHTRMSQGAASADDAEGVGRPFAGANGILTSAGEQSFSPNGRRGSAASLRARRNRNLLESESPQSPPPYGVKSSPGAFDNMSPEPMLASVEGDVPMTDAGESLSRLQTEMGHLRRICQNVVASSKNMREVDLDNVETELSVERSRVRDLEARVNQLAGVVNALQNTSLGSIVDRVDELERIVEQLRAKVGGGCDAEVANMREVMGGLKGLLDKVGGFA